MEPDDLDTEMTGESAGALSSLPEALAADRKNRQMVERQIRSNMDALMQARDSIRQQRTGPSAAERLFAISAALGRPTRTGSLGETMGNLSEVLGSQEKAKREAALENAALAEKYGMEIGDRQLRLLQSQLAGSGQMVNRALAAAKPKQRRTGFDPLTGQLRYMDTGEAVTPGAAADEELPVLTPEQVAAAKAAGMHLRFRTTDGRELEI